MYLYQADVWCDDCGHNIRARIDAETNGQYSDLSESEYDSDDYPKYADDDCESDCPQHCASADDCRNAITLPSGRKIGCLLSDTLTADGTAYVNELVRDEPESEVVRLWADHFPDADARKIFTKRLDKGQLPRLY